MPYIVGFYSIVAGSMLTELNLSKAIHTRTKKHAHTTLQTIHRLTHALARTRAHSRDVRLSAQLELPSHRMREFFDRARTRTSCIHHFNKRRRTRGECCECAPAKAASHPESERERARGARSKPWKVMFIVCKCACTRVA